MLLVGDVHSRRHHMLTQALSRSLSFCVDACLSPYLLLYLSFLLAQNTPTRVLVANDIFRFLVRGSQSDVVHTRGRSDSSSAFHQQRCQTAYFGVIPLSYELSHLSSLVPHSGPSRMLADVRIQSCLTPDFGPHHALKCIISAGSIFPTSSRRWREVNWPQGDRAGHSVSSARLELLEYASSRIVSWASQTFTDHLWPCERNHRSPSPLKLS